jgi:cytochrome c-type biogenesis protein CcmH/NrfF
MLVCQNQSIDDSMRPARIAALSPCSPTRSCPIPRLESRARDLSRELRCMVCQNQSIDDSDAPLARDLRLWCASGSRPATATRR